MPPISIRYPRGHRRYPTDIGSLQVDGPVYARAYFRLDSGYAWGRGMPDSAYARFREEVVDVLGSIGFSPEPGTEQRAYAQERTGSAPVMVRGRHESAYCHPMDISGRFGRDDIDAIAQALNRARHFKLRAVDVYEEFVPLSTAQALSWLRSRRERLERFFYDAHKTPSRRRWHPVLGRPAMALALLEESLGALLDDSTKEAVTAFDKQIVDGLVASGVLLTAEGQYGRTLYRSRNKGELRTLIRESRGASLSRFLVPAKPWPALFEGLKTVEPSPEFELPVEVGATP